MSSIDGDFNQNFQDAIDVIQQHSNNSYYDSEYSYHETLTTVQQPWYLVPHPSDAAVSTNDWSDTAQQPWTPALPDVPLSQSLPPEPPHFYTIPPPQSNKGRKKLRLYEYLHQALNDPNMCDSIQWTDSGSGTFHFISKNKEKLAECWGQRKGNRKTMTYQKMARALRNYSRTGEIIKVRRKLTYQFNPDILHRLGSSQVNVALPRQPAQEEHCPQQQTHGDQAYGSFTSGESHNWYGHYLMSEDYDLCQSYTSHIKS
ncbi:transcription factor Spi-C isoform X1 [Periophthalmus magnuspinnatus]|uniref:transcription factor Spi-C isoform X1 n=1 Tax=Periophthalmus magnuspinnatus TaxID=409849 RepID=UPI00145A40A2|nr:transcription factor Spi-C isoform X1 [Periophthalmus magnuspinnatus]